MAKSEDLNDGSINVILIDFWKEIMLIYSVINNTKKLLLLLLLKMPRDERAYFKARVK